MIARCKCACGAELSVEVETERQSGAVIRCACGLAYKVDLDKGEPWLVPWKRQEDLPMHIELEVVGGAP